MTRQRTPGLVLVALLLGPGADLAWGQVRPPQEPSNVEQLLIYELNRARNDPARFGRENNLAVDLTTVAPQPPLAVNNNLVGSASFHVEEMATFNYFGHQSAVTGDWPNKMARDNSYTLPASYPNDTNNIESLAAGTNLTTAVGVLRLLIEDAGTNPPGHRIQLLATNSFFQTHREVGTGYAANPATTFRNYFAIHTALRASVTPFLTGVVYFDANGNGRYDLGEGLGGVTVSNGITSALTNAAGGWSIPVSAGSFTVTAFGGGFIGAGTAAVTVAGANVEIDFNSGNAAGEVNFARQATSPLVAAVLPTSRSVQVGTPATVFATMINTGPSLVTGCGVAPTSGIPATFAYQTTDSTTNQVTGTANTPVSIAPGAAQSYVLVLTPTGVIAPTEVAFSFACANASPARSQPGLNTLLFSAAAGPVPDVVALAATPTGNGVVTVAGAAAFAVATVNLGAGAMITASVDTGGTTLPIAVSLCETNPFTGACLGPAASSVTTQIDAGETPTFGVFVAAAGTVPFDPAANRIFVRFRDAGGVTRGATSVAVRTP